MYYDQVLSLEAIDCSIDGYNVSLTKGVHYFASAYEMVLNGHPNWKQKYPNVA